jgi:mannose-6-phosphate isomerase
MSSSPFSHSIAPGPDSATAVLDGGGRDDAVTAHDVERVDKPWGFEQIFAVLEGRYVGKVLHLDAGAALSLQKHLRKDETVTVRVGRVEVEIGPDENRLQTVALEPGQRLHIRAGLVHRLTAVVDSEVLEVSTAWPGWRTDVVRLADSYGRAGTTAP